MREKIRFYVGTYTEAIKFGTGQILQGRGEGIYLLELDPQTGSIELKETFNNLVNPSYLAIDKKNGFLYAVNELKEYQGKPSGSVSAFKISDTGGLEFLNKQPTNGTDPCHVELNSDHSTLFVSNFASGSVCVYPILPDGSIGEYIQFIQHAGSSIHPTRQSGPHAHSLVLSPYEKFAFVPDLGLDKLMVYRTNVNGQPLSEAVVPYFEVKPGAGPRHCTFSPAGDHCYLINELDCTILVLSYDAETGIFTEMQSVSSLPDGVEMAGNSCADVHITPNGKFLYGSNRGHNSLIIYAIDQDTGLLSYVDCQPCGGAIPRNFCIDPTGEYLLCANQDSYDIVVFKIDPASGMLSEASRVTIPTPVCIKPYM